MASTSKISSGMANLPPELWAKIFRFATLPEPANASASQRLQSILCAKNNSSMLDDLPDGGASLESYAQLKTKRSLTLVNRFFHHLAKEFLLEILFIPDDITAESLAEMADGPESECSPSIRNWARQIIIATPSRFSSASCQKLTAAVIRIISKLCRLEVFYMRWKSPRRLEEQIVDALPPSIKHFEWHNPGGGFSSFPKRPLSRFLHGIKDKLEVLRVSGYLPLPGPTNNADAYGGDKCEFPSLRQLSVSREFYCDLHLISTWVTSDNLTCLSLGTFWSYPKLRDPQCSFFNVPLPSLQCMHLGKSARTSPKLLRTILGSATHLRCLEYAFAGDSDVGIWEDIEHHHLERVEIHLSPTWDLRAIGAHLRSFAAAEFLHEDGHPVRFQSLDCLKFITGSAFGEKQGETDNLKSFIRMATSSATCFALEFQDGAL